MHLSRLSTAIHCLASGCVTLVATALFMALVLTEQTAEAQVITSGVDVPDTSFWYTRRNSCLSKSMYTLLLTNCIAIPLEVS